MTTTSPTRSPYDSEDIWAPVISVFIFNFILFFLAQLKRDNSIVDIAWGLLFVTAVLTCLIVSNNWDFRTILTLVLISVWGLRLSFHILLRHSLKRGGEDYRYQEMRQDWMRKGGLCYYYFASFTFVFMMQALFSLVVNSSALFICIWSDGQFYPLDAIGAAVWFGGFIFEAIGDYQLQEFKKNPENKGRVIKSGLWRYTRHPNYFGESVQWWGISLIACSIDYGWITLYSALFITLLVRYVSGVPLLEKKQMEKEEFRQYMKETNCFIPWFPKTSESKDYKQHQISVNSNKILDQESFQKESDMSNNKVTAAANK